MSKRYHEEFRRSVLADYRQSSMSQVDFARQHGLNVYTFREWLYRGVNTGWIGLIRSTGW